MLARAGNVSFPDSKYKDKCVCSVSHTASLQLADCVVHHSLGSDKSPIRLCSNTAVAVSYSCIDLLEQSWVAPVAVEVGGAPQPPPLPPAAEQKRLQARERVELQAPAGEAILSFFRPMYSSG